MQGWGLGRQRPDHEGPRRAVAEVPCIRPRALRRDEVPIVNLGLSRAGDEGISLLWSDLAIVHEILDRVGHAANVRPVVLPAEAGVTAPQIACQNDTYRKY